MDRLKVMETFVEIAEAGSFAKAARKLSISRAVASNHIQQLETTLRAQLFHRTTRNIALTEAGERHLAFARRMLADFRSEYQTISQLQAYPSGTLRLTAPMGFGNARIAPIIMEFLSAHPGIRVSLDVHGRSQSPLDLKDAQFDLAICLIKRFDDSSYVGRRIGEERWVACASPDYLKRHPPVTVPSHLLQHNCMLILNDIHKPWTFESGKSRTAVNVTGSLAGSLTVCREGALAGLGIALLPTYTIEGDVAAGTLKTILPGHIAERRTVLALYNRDKYLPSKVRVFLDFLTKRLKKADR